MSLQRLPLHVALLLCPLLGPKDIVRARRVCKDWNDVFGSPKLSQTALRIHFPLSREARLNQRSNSSPEDPPWKALFYRVSRRHEALRSGRPRQELRLPTKRSRDDHYIWTYSECMLVYQSSVARHFRKLSLLYLDFDAEKITCGTLDIKGDVAIKNIRIYRGLLAVEKTEEKQVPRMEGFTRVGTNFHCSVDFYRLTVVGDPNGEEGEIVVEKVSNFPTYSFNYVDYSHSILSDHSTTHYVSYTRHQPYVWLFSIKTGQRLRKFDFHNRETISRSLTVKQVFVVSTAEGDDGEVVALGFGAERSQNSPSAANDWTYRRMISVCPFRGDEIDLGNSGEGSMVKTFVGRKLEGYWDMADMAFKSSSTEYPAFTDKSHPQTRETIVSSLCEFSKATQCGSSYNFPIPRASTLSKANGNEPLPASAKYTYQASKVPIDDRRSLHLPNSYPIHGYFFSFFVPSDGISFTMVPGGHLADFGSSRLPCYYFVIHSFYPSSESASYTFGHQQQQETYSVQWSNALKERSINENSVPKARKIFPPNRNVIYGRSERYDPRDYGLQVMGDERAVVFLELQEKGMEIVVGVWGEPFRRGVKEVVGTR